MLRRAARSIKGLGRPVRSSMGTQMALDAAVQKGARQVLGQFIRARSEAVLKAPGFQFDLDQPLHPFTVDKLPGVRCFHFGRQPNVGVRRFSTLDFTATPDDAPIMVFGPNTRVDFAELNIKAQGVFCYFGPDSLLRGLRIQLLGHGSNIITGRNVQTGSVLLALKERATTISIGDDTLFSHGITMRTSDMHGIFDIASGDRINPAGDIAIANHVWIGQDCHLMKGISIGKSSVVGAASVVVKSLPENVVAAGVPARVIRSGITWDRKLMPRLPG